MAESDRLWLFIYLLTVRPLLNDLEVPSFEVLQDQDGVFDGRVVALGKGQRLQSSFWSYFLHFRYEPTVRKTLVFKSSYLQLDLTFGGKNW